MFVFVNMIEVLADQNRSGYFSKDYTLSGNKASDLVLVAKAQIGKTQSNLAYSEDWCADFVADCARLAGISDSVIPYNISGYANVGNLYNYLINYCSASKVYTRQAGDLLFYNCPSHGLRHVSIVEDSTYSIEGNMWTTGISKVERISEYYSDCGHKTSDGTLERWYVRPNFDKGLNSTTPSVSVANGKTFMSWNATENAHSYNVRIRNSDGTPYKDIWNVIETSIQTILPVGSYKVYIDSILNDTVLCGETVSFNVSENYIGPSDSNLSVNTSDNVVHLSWSEATNAQLYNIRIYHSNGTDYTVWNQTGTSCDVVLPLGTYKAYVDSCNDVDVTKGRTIQFTVTQSYADVGKPLISATVTKGKTFITWSDSKNATAYNVRIRNSDGTPYKDIWNIIETSVQTVLPKGTYRVYIDAVNDYAVNASDIITFNVAENYAGPSESNLSVNTSDNVVHLSWSEATNAQLYNIRIYHSDGTDYTVWNQTGTSCDVVLPLGTYKAYVDSCNDVDVTKGKTIQFTVISCTNTDSFYTFEDTSIEQNDINYVINFELKKSADYSGESNVYVCIYDKNGTFVGLCSSKVNSEGKYSLDITNFYKKNTIVKLFLWDNMMRPLSQSKTID